MSDRDAQRRPQQVELQLHSSSSSNDSSLINLPDEVLLKSLELLPVEDVVSSRAVCSRLGKLACEPQLVDAVTRRDFGDQNMLGQQIHTNWNAYKNQKLGMVERAKFRADRRMQLLEVHKQERLQRALSTLFSVFHHQVVISSFATLLLVGVVLIPLKLDDSLPWNWSSVLFPWFLLESILWAGTISIALVNCLHNHWLLDHIHHSDWNGVLTSFSREVVRSNPLANLIALAILLCITIATVLISLRADGIISWNYYIIFLPVWLIFLLVIAAPFTEWVPGGDRFSFFVLLWSLGLLWFAMFMVLLCIHLDAGPSVLHLETAFIPIWILDGLYIGGTLLIALTMGLVVLVTRGNNDICTAVDARRMALFAFSTLLFLGPITAFELLLVLRLRMVISVSFFIVFLPLIVWAWVLCILTIFFIALST